MSPGAARRNDVKLNFGRSCDPSAASTFQIEETTQNLVQETSPGKATPTTIVLGGKQVKRSPSAGTTQVIGYSWRSGGISFIVNVEPPLTIDHEIQQMIAAMP